MAADKPHPLLQNSLKMITYWIYKFEKNRPFKQPISIYCSILKLLGIFVGGLSFKMHCGLRRPFRMGCSYLVAAGAHLFRLEGRDYVAVLNLFHRTTPWPLKISGRMLTENAAPSLFNFKKDSLYCTCWARWSWFSLFLRFVLKKTLKEPFKKDGKSF